MGSITVKVFGGNTNPCDVIVCGSEMYERFKTVEVPSSLLSVRRVTSSTRIIHDSFMRPNSFIGMDSKGDWLFSSL